MSSDAAVRHTCTLSCTFEYSELGVPSTWYKSAVATCSNSTIRRFVPGSVKANNNSLGNHYCWVVTHCHKLPKPSPHYTMIESTLRFTDVGVVPGLLLLLQAVQSSCMPIRTRSRRWPGNKGSQSPLCRTNLEEGLGTMLDLTSIKLVLLSNYTTQ